MKYSKNKFEYKPYKAYNTLVKNMEVQIEPQPEPEQTTTHEVGYINVGVYSASGALPVENAVVTVYHTYNADEEHVLYHLITNESGRVPTMVVPVEYQGPGSQTQYYYSTYNLRVQATDYYTVNILDIQIYPDISTNFRVNLIPTAPGTSEAPEHTIVIPERQ